MPTTKISNLKRHEKKHSKDKPFSCSQCGKEFITQQNCLQHQAKHQANRHVYKCEKDECEKSYLYLCSLRKHMRESHRLMKEPQKKVKMEEKPIDAYFTQESLNVQYKNLKEFFTCSHP